MVIEASPQPSPEGKGVTKNEGRKTKDDDLGKGLSVSSQLFKRFAV